MSIVIQLPRDINRFCRTCMNVTEDLKNAFENYVVCDNQPTDLSKMLRSVTSLNVTAEDGLPETLCSQCTEHLTAAYTFINQCKDVDANLRSLLMLSQQSEKEAGTSDHSEKLRTVVKTQLESIKCAGERYVCHICNDTFTSQYILSRHMIEHNAGKNLLERLVENEDQDSKIGLIHKVRVDLDIDTINLIKERKSTLKMKTNEFNTELSSDKAKESNKTAMDIDVGDENASDVPLKMVNNVRLLKSAEKKTGKTKIECKMCYKKFNFRKDLVSHICTPLTNEHASTNSDSKLLTTCTLCEKNFPDLSTLSLHFLKHALATTNMANASIEAEFFFCEVCGETFDSELFLLEHYNEKHEGKPTWPCSSCSKVFEKEIDLIKHDELHSNENLKVFIKKENVCCVLCNGIFPSKKSLLKHSIEHLMKKYSCKKCSLSFCTQHAYSEHSKSHSVYQYTCSTCGKVLSTKSALKAHIVGVHSVDLRHTCTTCGKSFATPSRLRTHSDIHKNTKKYVCSYCGYSAHKAGDLQIHTRIHTSERPYKCTFAKCSASFKTSSHLCDHVRRHLQIRKFKCSICAVGFSTNHGLKVHQLQHTGERPHSCVVCHQKFRRKYHVKVHMKQHEPKL